MVLGVEGTAINATEFFVLGKLLVQEVPSQTHGYLRYQMEKVLRRKPGKVRGTGEVCCFIENERRPF